MFQTEQSSIENQIFEYFRKKNLPIDSIHWNWIPFSGHWGISTSFFQAAAIEARAGKGGNVGQRAMEMAAEMAAEFIKTWRRSTVRIERVEAVKGYLNLYFSTFSYANRVIDTVLSETDQFGINNKLKSTGNGGILAAQYT